MSIRELHCDCCAELRRFEQPPCQDRHGAECPDWICTGCGAAMFLAGAVISIDPVRPEEMRRRAA